VHNTTLLERLPDAETRVWYARKAIEHGWSCPVMALQIKQRLHLRRGKAVNNFEATLPPASSDMAAQIFEDPYLFDFLGTADVRREREVEQALVDHIQRFLLELGKGSSGDEGRTRAPRRWRTRVRDREPCWAWRPISAM
jgi:predicted nuclease of restriction endonuclease-like (RecB) superfamily